MFDAVYLLYLVREVGLDAAEVGLILAVGNTGIIAAALLAKPLARRVGAGPVLIGGAAGRAVGAMAAPAALIAAPLTILPAGRFLTALGVVLFNVQQISLRQAITPRPLLGRMNATMRFVTWGTIPVGTLLGGAIASIIGLWPTLWIGITIGLLATVPLLVAHGIGWR